MTGRGRAYRGISRGDSLVPAGKVSLGDRVWWGHTYWLAGYPSTHWTMGLVEVKRGEICVIRNRYGHTWEVGVGKLFKPETET